MEWLLNGIVIVTTIFAFIYLGFVILYGRSRFQSNQADRHRVGRETNADDPWSVDNF